MKRGRTLRRIALVLAALLVLQLGATGAVYRAIFSRWEGSGALPGAETHSFWVGDNRLQGYYLPASDARGLVVVCPGFHSTAAAYGPQLEWLRQRGWSVFAYDPTGCGRSQGAGTVGFCQAVRDLNGALDYLAGQNRLGHRRLVLLGHSQGGYAACCVLHDRQDVDGLVTVNAVNSALETELSLALDRVGVAAYAGVPFLWAWQSLLFGPELTGRQAADCLRRSPVPALVIQGSADAIIGSEALYTHLGAEDPRCLLYGRPGQSGHTDLLFDGDGPNQELMGLILEYYNALD